MGVDGEDGEVPGQFSSQGRKEYHGGEAAATEGRELVLSAVVRSNEGDRDGWDTDINLLEAEYGCAIHFDTADYGHVRTYYPAARRAVVSAVVGTGGDRLELSAGEGGRSSGRTGNGGGFGFGVRGRTGKGLRRNRGGGSPES